MELEELLQLSTGIMQIGPKVKRVDNNNYYLIDNSFIWFGSKKNNTKYPDRIELIDHRGVSKGVYFVHYLPTAEYLDIDKPVDHAIIWIKEKIC